MTTHDWFTLAMGGCLGIVHTASVICACCQRSEEYVGDTEFEAREALLNRLRVLKWSVFHGQAYCAHCINSGRAK